MKISEIDVQLKNTPVEQLLKAIEVFNKDERAGVQKLCQKYYKQWEKQQKIIQEWQDKLYFDEVFHHGNQVYVGIDEVGRGPLAGPVVAAAVILPCECNLLGLKDSKKLSEEKREALYTQIQEVALDIGVGIVDSEEIDTINILQATFKAMRMALGELELVYDVIGVDGDKSIPGVECVQHTIIKGDDKSAAIAAASVIAKVTRDRMMKEYAKTYPEYDWTSNKGYGSQKHYDAIRAHGITSLHRKSFLKNEGY